MFTTSPTTLSTNMSSASASAAATTTAVAAVPPATSDPAFKAAVAMHTKQVYKSLAVVWDAPDGSSATTHLETRAVSRFVADLEKCMEAVLSNRIAEEKDLARAACLRDFAFVLEDSRHCKTAAILAHEEARLAEQSAANASAQRDPFPLVDLRARFRVARELERFAEKMETDQATRDKFIDYRLSRPGSDTRKLIDVELYNRRKRTAAALSACPVPSTPDQPIRRVQPSAPKRHKSAHGGVSLALPLVVAYDNAAADSLVATAPAVKPEDDAKAAPSSSSPDGDETCALFLDSPVVSPAATGDPTTNDELSKLVLEPLPEVPLSPIGLMPSIYDGAAHTVPLSDLFA